MNDYRLDRLSPRLFEHMVQGLAVGAISSTVTPFGDGPDGGREATFKGSTSYGTEGDFWNGYGIIQAKFHIRPQDTTRDAAWARRELRKELAQFNKNKRPTPDYYIYAVNVVLTPGEGQGKDSVKAILDQFATKHKLKGVDLWDYDKIRVLLDRDEKVRNSYLAWILPSDVLAALCANLRTTERDYYPLILRYLQRELISDQYAQLEQAGHSADEAIPLSQVFLDLSTSRTPPAVEDIDYEETNSTRFVATIIQDAGASFKTSDDDDEGPVPERSSLRSARAKPGRYVLIGGPGQGKTTVGQYVCQVFRYALLNDVPPRLLSADTRSAIDGFNRQWQHDKPLIPKARRLPFRVVLGDLARSLAEQETSSLLEYLARKFSANSASAISGNEIERIMTEYPSIIILDGLDEVPSSTNREALMNVVSSFLVDVAAGSLDVMLLATSRPQGYNEEFSPRQYAHHYLLPLSAEDALKYGRQLAKNRFGGGNERYSKVVERIERAAHNPATARLMHTPLQVTILTLLVDRIGTPPEERWALFSAYYRLIFERETERDIESVAVLKTHSIDIDAIHRRVGLALQVESERSGGTDARLTVDQFSKIVDDYLEEEGNQQPLRDKLKAQIIEAAGNRLVFLVGLESGQVGFEIRSLQEFMAAEGLMEGPDAVVQDRLKEVASSGHWRNVFLFAAGQCFSVRRYLRDTIEAICVDLNEDANAAFRMLHVGSALALDLLEDGPARKQPTKRRSLTRLAVQLLGLPQQEARRLADVCEDDTCDIFLEQIRRELLNTDDLTKSSAWACLAYLIELRGGEFEQLGRDVIASHALNIRSFNAAFEQARGRNDWLSSVLFEYVRTHAPRLEPTVRRIYSQKNRLREFGPWTLSDYPAWLSWYAAFNLGPIRRRVGLSIRVQTPDASFRFLNANSCRSHENQADFLPPGDSPSDSSWQLIQAAGRFCAGPSAETLATAMHSYLELRSAKNLPAIMLGNYPWPLSECIRAARYCNGESILSLLDTGGFGDLDDWLACEQKWAEGISINELLSLQPLLNSADSRNELYLFPFRANVDPERGVNHEITSHRPIVDAFDQSASSVMKSFFANLILNRRIEVDVRSDAGDTSWIDRVLMANIANRDYLYPQFFELIDIIDYRNPGWNSLLSSMSPRALVAPRPVEAMRAGVTLREIIDLGSPFEGFLVPFAIAMSRLPFEARMRLSRPMTISADAGPSVKLAAIFIDIVAGVGISELSERIELAMRGSPNLLLLVLNAIVLRDLPYEEECEEILKCINIMPQRSSDFLNVLQQNFLRRRSRLSDYRIWSDLELPRDMLRVLELRGVLSANLGPESGLNLPDRSQR